jgi:hypothetical protein
LRIELRSLIGRWFTTTGLVLGTAYSALQLTRQSLTGLQVAVGSLLLAVAAAVPVCIEYLLVRRKILKLERALREASRGDGQSEQLLLKEEEWLLSRLYGLTLQENQELLATGARLVVRERMKGAENIARNGLWLFWSRTARESLVSEICSGEGSSGPVVDALVEGLENRIKALESPKLWGWVLDALKQIQSDALYLRAVDNLCQRVELEGRWVIHPDDAAEYLGAVRPGAEGLRRLEAAAKTIESRKQLYERAYERLYELTAADERELADEFRRRASQYEQLAKELGQILARQLPGGAAEVHHATESQYAN